MNLHILTRRAPCNRLPCLLVLLAIQWLYFPINLVVQGGNVLKTPLDILIPLWPMWTVPYILSMAWWLACLIWAAWKMDDLTYRSFILSADVVMLASYIIYLMVPTYVERPTLEGNSWPIQWLQWVYSHDRPYNAFPSSHTYNTVIVFLFWRRWYPPLTWLWGGMVVIVLCSTLFTRQHNLPDLLGGILLAWLGVCFGLWFASRSSKGV
jgi:membrane-associated phospholipid phosphatase